MEDKKIYQALGRIMADVGSIQKGQKNAQQGFMFRGIDDFMNSLHGLFAKYGVVIVPTETEHIQEQVRYNSGGYEKIQFRSRVHMTFMFISCEDGSMVVADGWGEAADNGDKGYNKCKSIALKYVLMQMFLVPTADIADPDKDTPDEITSAPEEKPKAKPTKAAKTKVDSSVMDEAMAAIADAKSRTELNDIYAKYGVAVSYDAKFIAALNEKVKVV